MLAGEVRQGTTPALSALAVIIIGMSLIGAIIYEVMKRREEAQAERDKENAKIAERSDGGAGAAGLKSGRQRQHYPPTQLGPSLLAAVHPGEAPRDPRSRCVSHQFSSMRAF